MRHKLTRLAGALAVLGSIGTAAQATPISGSIGFTGAFTQNGGTLGDLTTATSMTISTIKVGDTTGNFVGATELTFASPILVNPASGLSALWTVLDGSTTYTFTV